MPLKISLKVLAKLPNVSKEGAATEATPGRQRSPIAFLRRKATGRTGDTHFRHPQVRNRSEGCFRTANRGPVGSTVSSGHERGGGPYSGVAVV